MKTLPSIAMPLALALMMAPAALAGPSKAPQVRAPSPNGETPFNKRRGEKPTPVPDIVKRHQALLAEQAKNGKGPLVAEPAVRAPNWTLPPGAWARYADTATEQEVTGVFAEVSDGAMRLAQPLPPQARQAWSDHNKQPLVAAPKEVSAWLLLDASVSPVGLQRKIGQVVQVKVKKDRAGVAYVTDIQLAK